ncbi:hypothetical protein [Quisquiliibacterium transsilvanicum]|jgi:hypothetical protein|uniref:Uncharacterized protein n=1 Tax=Quisquiliibacterium transsilvanicum TaxID=1549638 RepID=A0A7W8M8R1_9BURK|nr:hypothetical protein [Quisquiliibacterium transsilvanicum]MBB5271289.1 hypothetical protein [Quisquiliibacterium transsilvanicum]
MPNQVQYTNVTLVDVQLASAYYPLLIDLAKHKHCLTYGELVERARKEYPDRPVVQKAIAVSTGRRLDVVRMFTTERELPDLTSLIINKGSGECGIGFTRSFDPKAAREEVFSFDWSAVTTDFDGFVKHTETVIAPRKPVKEAKALELMAAHYQLHKASLPPSIRESRDQVVELIMEGFNPEEAFALAQQNNA